MVCSRARFCMGPLTLLQETGAIKIAVRIRLVAEDTEIEEDLDGKENRVEGYQNRL